MSTHGDVPGATILGRPFKPLAVGLILGSTVLAVDLVATLAADPVLQQQTPVSGFCALFAVTGMLVAWLIRSQRLYEWSLLLVMGLWMGRAVELALLVTVADGLLPFSIAFMAGGAYWLEKISFEHRMR